MNALHILSLIIWAVIGIHALTYEQIDTVKFACLWITFILSQLSLLFTFHSSIPNGKAHDLTSSQDPQIRRLTMLNSRIYYSQKLLNWIQLASRSDIPMILAVLHHIQQISLKSLDESELKLYDEYVAGEKEFDDE